MLTWPRERRALAATVFTGLPRPREQCQSDSCHLFCLSGLFVPSAFGQTHFHHAHLNSTDPAAAIDFYTTHLSGEKATFDGRDAVWTQKWLLFTKVKQAPPSEVVSALFHIGWGAEDMKAEFERQMKLGTTFQTVLTDGVELFGVGTRDRNFFMYLDGPDHVTIEVQSAMHHDFMHVHLFSDDPVAAAAWYQQHLGIATRTKLETVRAFRGIPTGPSASMQLDNVTFWIYPTAHAKALYGGQWKGRTRLCPPTGARPRSRCGERGRSGRHAGTSETGGCQSGLGAHARWTDCGRPSSRPRTRWSWSWSKATPGSSRSPAHREDTKITKS